MSDQISDLPLQTKTFQIDLIGKFSKKRYLGDFTCKIPRIKEQCLIARHEAFLNGEYGQFLEQGIKNIHKMIAYLRFTLTEFPKFWKDSDLGYELMDTNVIEKVYEEVLGHEEEWLKEVWGDDESDVKE